MSSAAADYQISTSLKIGQKHVKEEWKKTLRCFNKENKKRKSEE